MSLADFMRFQWNPNADAAQANDQEENVNEENEEARADPLREAMAAMAAENNAAAAILEDLDAEREEAAMPDPFEMDAGVNLGRHHHHHPHHRRNQWQRQRDGAPLDNADDTDGNVENHDVHDEADARARRQMERIRGRIEERRRQNRDVVQRETNRPMSPELSDDDDLYDDEYGGDHATAAADRRSSLHETDLLLPLDTSLDTWLGRTDAAAGAASSSSPPHSRTGSLSSLPSLHRDAVGVMDEGEPFFSNDRARARARSTDDDDEELRRRRRLLVERAALRRQGGCTEDVVAPKNDAEDIDLVADKSEGAQHSSPPTPTLEREAIDDDISDLVSYNSDDSHITMPPLENVEMMDSVDEAALENMMRLQEEAMLDLDDSDDESEDGDADLQADAPGDPVAQQGHPQNDGGRFEPQFGREERFEQEEEEDMVSISVFLCLLRQLAPPARSPSAPSSYFPVPSQSYALYKSYHHRKWNFNSPLTSSSAFAALCLPCCGILAFSWHSSQPTSESLALCRISWDHLRRDQGY